jgi:hypothetical protein
MSLDLKKILVDYKEEMRGFEKQVLAGRIEKKYPLSAINFTLMQARGLFMPIVIPFNNFLDKKLLKEAVLYVIQKHGLMRSVMVREKGKLLWQQHEAPQDVSIPYIDVSKYSHEEKIEINRVLHSSKFLYDFPTTSSLYMLSSMMDYLPGRKKYTKKFPFLFRVILGLARIARYFNKKSHGRTLLYRLVLIKKNLKDHVLFFNIDHILVDYRSLDILESDICQYYNSGGKDVQREAVSYDQYVYQIAKGPMEIEAEDLAVRLNLNEWRPIQNKITEKFRRDECKGITTFVHRIDFQRYPHISTANAWAVTLALLVMLAREIFDIPKAPTKVVYSCRKYGGINFYNTVGVFSTSFPMVLEFNQDDPFKIIKQAYDFVDVCEKHNLNFNSFPYLEFSDEAWEQLIHLYEYQYILPMEPTIIFNFVGGRLTYLEGVPGGAFITTQQSVVNRDVSRRELLVVKFKGRFITFVSYTPKAIFFELESLLKFDVDHMAGLFDKTLEKISRQLGENAGSEKRRE